MLETVEKDLEQEPIGIVISRGSRAEAAPRFWAYVWGQAEDVPPPTGTKEVKAA